MYRAIRFNRLGGPEVLSLVDMPEREPNAGDVVLKVEAVGLNRAEAMYFRGSISSALNCRPAWATRRSAR